MTYNFDPDRWYENEYAALERALQNGGISSSTFERAVKKLQVRLNDMWKRLDGTYCIETGPESDK